MCLGIDFVNVPDVLTNTGKMNKNFPSAENIGTRRGWPLEVNINHKSKTVEVWLNIQEARDPALKERLRLLYQVFAIQKYMVAVFRSGRGDLVQSTSDLLCYNRKRVAQLEVESEKQMELAK